MLPAAAREADRSSADDLYDCVCCRPQLEKRTVVQLMKLQVAGLSACDVDTGTGERGAGAGAGAGAGGGTIFPHNEIRCSDDDRTIVTFQCMNILRHVILVTVFKRYLNELVK